MDCVQTALWSDGRGWGAVWRRSIFFPSYVSSTTTGADGEAVVDSPLGVNVGISELSAWCSRKQEKGWPFLYTAQEQTHSDALKQFGFITFLLLYYSVYSSVS